MVVGHIKELEGIKLEGENLAGVIKKVLISPQNGWEGWVMRVFEIEPGGYTPKHIHNWPHINWIIEGKGTLLLDDKLNKIEGGSFAYVPNNVPHQFKNEGDNKLSFICIVPLEGEV
ncbi:MAG: cupin domain-containing protein [Bacillota bacterium]